MKGMKCQKRHNAGVIVRVSYTDYLPGPYRHRTRRLIQSLCCHDFSSTQPPMTLNVKSSTLRLEIVVSVVVRAYFVTEISGKTYGSPSVLLVHLRLQITR